MRWRSGIHGLVRRGAARVVPVADLSTFDDGETLDLPGRPRVVHAPGHTEGSCALFLEDRKALLTGDCLVTWNAFTGRVGPQIMPAGLNRDSEALASPCRKCRRSCSCPATGSRGGTAPLRRSAWRGPPVVRDASTPTDHPEWIARTASMVSASSARLSGRYPFTRANRRAMPPG